MPVVAISFWHVILFMEPLWNPVDIIWRAAGGRAPAPLHL